MARADHRTTEDRSIGVGGGGVFALYLAARRQRSTELQLWQHERDLAQRLAAQRHVEQVAAANSAHQERVAAATEADAAERRVTELYGKAADQLGSDRAPVRMAGLYALATADGDWREERHVRDTAVSILVTHLQPYVGIRNTPDDPRFLWRRAHTAEVPANPKFWPDIRFYDMALFLKTKVRAEVELQRGPVLRRSRHAGARTPRISQPFPRLDGTGGHDLPQLPAQRMDRGAPVGKDASDPVPATG